LDKLGSFAQKNEFREESATPDSPDKDLARELFKQSKLGLGTIYPKTDKPSAGEQKKSHSIYRTKTRVAS